MFASFFFANFDRCIDRLTSGMIASLHSITMGGDDMDAVGGNE
jgi:hypothetical protein